MSDRGMWLAVVNQAFIDATANISPLTDKSEIIARSKARTWLTTNTRDFRHVCDMAGLDPDAVRGRALTVKANGWPHEGANRAGRLGHGPRMAA
jgi:hypothetical protein